jgi:DNA-binding MarR family transcriptional regulator
MSGQSAGAGGTTSSAFDSTAVEVWTLISGLVLDNERRRQVSEALGMSFWRARALRRIAARPMPMGELAKMLGIDPPYMTIVVDDLQAQGLVERRPHPTDRRAKLVVATRQGKAAARRADAILATPPAELASLDAADLAELARILRKTVAEGVRTSPPSAGNSPR